ncbi:MAG: rhodanese-like domain-containing protein [Sphingobacterium sp.]
MKIFKILIFFLTTSYNSWSQVKIETTKMVHVIKSPQSQILDVRTPEEYSNGHIPNSTNVNWKDQPEFLQQIKTLNKNSPVYVYCLSGGRSEMASKLLTEKGFTVYNYSGGMMEWRNAEKPEIKLNEENKVDKLTIDQFTEDIKSDKLVLVNFSAKWCIPCQELKPIIDKIEKDHSGKVKIIRIDSDQNRKLAKTLNVGALPQLFLYKNGKVVWSKNSLSSEKEILNQLSKFEK